MTLFDFNKVISSHTANTAPTLAWTGETNYAGGGLYPLTGIPTTTFAYRVQYADADNDPPADGYPNVHIKKGGVDIAGSPFAMAYVSGDYNAGAIYRYPISSLAPGTDYTYFVASDTYSVQATGTPLTPISGPSVIGSAPTISSVVPNPASILTGAATTITCTASDPNGYTLIYTWSPGGGAISGTGAQVTWTAPALIGTYTVGVKVTNVHGGSVQSSTNVVVTASGSDQPDWVSIPGGTYMMGAADLSYATPVHQVTVPSFQMARTLVTNRQYRACVTAGACTAAYDYGAQYDGDDQPVVGVNWYQAKAFSAWAGGRLPSEAEWEYAARSGGQNQNYPWGNAAPDCSLAVYNYTLCGHSATATVCSTPAGNTAQGLCDMAGNAWEWVEDTWHSSYSGAPTDGSAWEDAGSGRVFRGGSWYGIAGYLRSADRNYYGGGGPGDRGSYLGFRPAR